MTTPETRVLQDRPQDSLQDRPKVSVVIPCYNEADCLHALHTRVSAACWQAVGWDYEIILINDASSDGTWRLMQQLSLHDTRLVCVDLARNHGHQLALTAGLSLCRGQVVFILDADLQDPPELLKPMLALLTQEQADVVYGVRRSRAGETLFKKLSARLFYRFLRRLTDVDIPADTGDFRLMSRRALDVFLAMPEMHRFVRGMVAWIGMKQLPFVYDRHERFAGTTKYPLRKMLKLTFDAITGFSTAPLKLASYLGFLLAIAGLCAIGYALWGWYTGANIPGWTSLMSVVLLASSAQMFVLGIFGEYLGRLYMQSKQRPLFTIQAIERQSGACQVPGQAPGQEVHAEQPWQHPAQNSF